MEEERKSNGSNGSRRPWIQRNGWAVTIMVALFGVCISTWANATNAINLANENKSILSKRTPVVGAVPHLKEDLESHVEDFKDFRNEQRIVNRSIQKSLDYLVKQSK